MMDAGYLVESELRAPAFVGLREPGTACACARAARAVRHPAPGAGPTMLVAAPTTAHAAGTVTLTGVVRDGGAHGGPPWAWSTAPPESWLGCGAIEGIVYCAGGQQSFGKVSRATYAYDPVTLSPQRAVRAVGGPAGEPAADHGRSRRLDAHGGGQRVGEGRAGQRAGSDGDAVAVLRCCRASRQNLRTYLTPPERPPAT